MIRIYVDVLDVCLSLSQYLKSKKLQLPQLDLAINITTKSAQIESCVSRMYCINFMFFANMSIIEDYKRADYVLVSTQQAMHPAQRSPLTSARG